MPAPRIAEPPATSFDLAEAHRAHLSHRFPALVLCNMVATVVWLVALDLAGDITLAAALATAATQLLVLVPAALACRRHPTSPWVMPLAIAAWGLVGISWIALVAASAGSGMVLGLIVFVVYVGAAIGTAWGLGPQLALQSVVTLAWMLALPQILKRLSFSERFVVAGMGSVIALVIAAWAAQTFRAHERRHRAEAHLSAELAASRDAFRDVYESARDFIWMADLKGRLTYVNAALARLHDRPAAAFVGQTVADLLTDHPDNPPLTAWQPGIERVRAGERLLPMLIQVRSRSGPRWVETVVSPVRDSSGRVTGLQASSRDVTERREAEETLRVSEEKLRLLAQRLVETREQERTRLGFDLHDDVCQELVGIGILVESVRRRLGPISSDAATDLQRITRYVNEVGEHLRLLARDLRPMLLHDVGLEGSLRSLVAGLTSVETTVRASFPTSIPRLEEVTEVAIYRIAQEALTNAVRHAQARAIELTLATTDRVLTLEVQDDGCGFAPGHRRGPALGLLSMEERALAIGGRLEVHSAPGRGAVIRLECPVAERSPASAA